VYNETRRRELTAHCINNTLKLSEDMLNDFRNLPVEIDNFEDRGS